MKTYKSKLFSFIFGLLFFNFNPVFSEEESIWVEIGYHESPILINAKIIFNQKVNNQPIYEKVIKWKDRKLGKGESAYWLSYDDYICAPICNFSISYYEVEKSTWIANEDRRYSPRKNIKYFFDKDDVEVDEDYKFTSKLKGFKSINTWFNYRLFLDIKSGQNCFIFGTQYFNNYEYPYAILDGIFCKSKNDKEFVEKEIKDILYNIGIKNIRNIPLEPKFEIDKNNININYNNLELAGNYEGELIYPDGVILPISTIINPKKNSKYSGKYSFKDIDGNFLNGTLSNGVVQSNGQIIFDWQDSYGMGWLKVEYLDKISEFYGTWGLQKNKKAVGEWNGYKISSIILNNEEDIETKLRKLKNLFENNLITEKEYLNKKTEILKGF